MARMSQEALMWKGILAEWKREEAAKLVKAGDTIEYVTTAGEQKPARVFEVLPYGRLIIQDDDLFPAAILVELNVHAVFVEA